MKLLPPFPLLPVHSVILQEPTVILLPPVFLALNAAVVPVAVLTASSPGIQQVDHLHFFFLQEPYKIRFKAAISLIHKFACLVSAFLLC